MAAEIPFSSDNFDRGSLISDRLVQLGVISLSYKVNRGKIPEIGEAWYMCAINSLYRELAELDLETDAELVVSEMNNENLSVQTARNIFEREQLPDEDLSLARLEKLAKFYKEKKGDANPIGQRMLENAIIAFSIDLFEANRGSDVIDIFERLNPEEIKYRTRGLQHWTRTMAILRKNSSGDVDCDEITYKYMRENFEVFFSF